MQVKAVGAGVPSPVAVKLVAGGVLVTGGVLVCPLGMVHGIWTAVGAGNGTLSNVRATGRPLT